MVRVLRWWTCSSCSWAFSGFLWCLIRFCGERENGKCFWWVVKIWMALQWLAPFIGCQVYYWTNARTPPGHGLCNKLLGLFCNFWKLEDYFTKLWTKKGLKRKIQKFENNKNLKVNFKLRKGLICKFWKYWDFKK